ncbi:SGT1 -like protein [Labeo rohita]|uniref:SGT1-like protein n=1 Tax=Labeo rohita TaxID=84645 RepID=A0A498NED4_LABRO|nr:SGT1 -like protein [Labeo rohita]
MTTNFLELQRESTESGSMASSGRFSDSFIHEDPQTALEELNAALGEKADNAEWLCQRAYACILLKEYTKAIEDAKKARELQPDLALAFLRIGIAEYHLHNFNAAHQALTAGKELDCSIEGFQTWIQDCENKIATHIPNQTSDLIEIKMKKTAAIQWEKLQGEGTLSTVKHFTPDQYPSSSHYTRNWDKVVGEIKEEEKNEKLEGDAALNKLFQQIYSDGSDEVKRAMNKSFMESGGTVLSTNWMDVGKRKVEMNPPDDVEWKKY